MIKMKQMYLQNNFTPKDKLVVMGDMNVAAADIDVGIKPENAKRWLKTGKCAFLPEEREWLNTLLAWGLEDTYRIQNPQRDDQYSWFDYRSKGFNDNRGLRIDLILTTPSMLKTLKNTGIDYELRGIEKPSDHAPIWAEFEMTKV